MSQNDNESVRITIRISTEAYEKLDELAKAGSYKNLSEVIRTAIMDFLKTKFVPPNIGKVTVDIPKTSLKELKRLIKAGDAVSEEDAIRTAIRDYLSKRFKELAKERIEEELFDENKEKK